MRFALMILFAVPTAALAQTVPPGAPSLAREVAKAAAQETGRAAVKKGVGLIEDDSWACTLIRWCDEPVEASWGYADCRSANDRLSNQRSALASQQERYKDAGCDDNESGDDNGTGGGGGGTTEVYDESSGGTDDGGIGGGGSSGWSPDDLVLNGRHQCQRIQDRMDTAQESIDELEAGMQENDCHHYDLR